MALRWMDSFNHYATAQVPYKYDFATANVSIAAAGRLDTNALFINGFDSRCIDKHFDGQDTWIVGFAWYLTQQGDSFIPIVSFWDGLGATTQVDLRFNSSRVLYATRNGTFLAGGSTALALNTWYHIQVKVVIGNSGSIEVKLNDVTEFSASPADTQNHASTATADMIRFGHASGGFSANAYWDDLYICDGTGSAPTNDFLGDCRVEVVHPNGNGNSSQFVGQDSNSTDNYLNVDETTAGPDGDTTYNEADTVGEKDTYAMGSLVTTAGTIYGVQPCMWARKTDAGSRSVASVARLSSTEVDSSNRTLSTSYTYYTDIREAKPGGGVWTIDDVNAAEFGMKVTA